MKHAAIYVRVSTKEQKEKGMSVDSQIHALIAHCEENGYSYTLYNDAGISAHIDYRKRPAMIQLIDDCRNDKVDLILFTKIDRFFRSIKDYYLVMDLTNGVKWTAIWQESLEAETASGRFFVNNMLNIAQMEAEIDSERIKSSLDFKKSIGQYVGTPPFGYKRVDGYLVKDEKTQSIVERIFQTYLETFSFAKTRDQFDRDEFILSANRYKRMMKCPVYYGKAQEGTCEPYITKEQFDRIQNIRRTRNRTPKNNHVYIFSGITRCSECGHKVRTQFSCPNGKQIYKQYHCGPYSAYTHEGPRVSISEKKIEAYMIKEVDRLLDSYDYGADLERENGMKKYKQEKKRLESKLQRVKFLFEEGDISVEDYKKKRNEIMNNLESLSEPTERPHLVLPDNWKKMYSELSEDGKKAFWSSIVKEIRLSRDKDPEAIFL